MGKRKDFEGGGIWGRGRILREVELGKRKDVDGDGIGEEEGC